MDMTQKMEAGALNILLAEDNEADAKIAHRAFQKSKYKNNLFIVEDGEDALDFLNRRGKYEDPGQVLPQLILLDINMPRMNGFEFMQALDADGRFCHIPIIMLTSSKNEEDILKSYRCGAAGYIPKPVAYADFVTALEGFNCYWHTVNMLPASRC